MAAGLVDILCVEVEAGQAFVSGEGSPVLGGCATVRVFEPFFCFLIPEFKDVRRCQRQRRHAFVHAVIRTEHLGDVGATTRQAC